MTIADAIWLSRAVEIAASQRGKTGLNPTVGCVIVCAGRVVAAAATAKGGRPHAEEQALLQAGSAVSGADVFVSLEPCDRRSAGGLSCTDLLISARPERVIIASHDPHPLAAGAGIVRLRAAGIQVQFLESALAVALNASFFAAHQKS